MRQAIAVGCVALCIVTARVAAASEQSKLLYSRGLVEFHADHFQKALELFDQAVAADDTDVYARYYRAVTRGRLNDVEGAIADLKVVLATKPDLDQAALDLGVALVQSGKYREAQRWLKQAQHSVDLDGQASLFLGIAQLRLGELDAAQVSFQRAETRDPKQTLAARYYLGVAAYQAGKLSASHAHFAYVAAAGPESAMGLEARTFMEKIQAAQAVGRYQIYGSVGFQYDSNVVLAPSNTALKSQNGIADQSDGSTTISFGGAYVPWHNDNITFSIGYDFFQSVHFNLVGFNLQDHGPSAEVRVNTDQAQFGLVGRYDYYMLENNSFLQEGTALPWVTVPENDLGRFEFYSRIRRRDFKNAAYFVLDSFNYAVGVRQVFYLGSPDRYFSLGYQFDRDDPVINNRIVPEDESNGPDSYAYDGNEANVGAGWILPQSISASATFAYRRERYKPQPSNGRKDDELLATLALSRPLTDHLDVIVAYLGNYNNSTNSLFDYDRSIASVAVEVRF